MVWRNVWLAVIFATGLTPATGVLAQPEIGQWKRFEYTIENPSWEGNPFAIAFKGVFQSPSGRTLEQWGFYAGGNSWRLYFMPDERGHWAFDTESDDPHLNGRSGTFQCVASNLPGKLTSDGPHWVLSNAGGIMPVIWNPPVPDGANWGFRAREFNHPTVQQTLDLAENTVGARLLGFDAILIAPIGWAQNYPQAAVPYQVGEEGIRFHLPFWNRLNAKLDQARDRGMGQYLMFYSDDEQKPDNFGLTPQSEKELVFFRYVLARLACYPIVLWDSGIDISEYRSNEWIDWFAEWINANDPWQHPVGSRTGGGSGGELPQAATYYSTGGAFIPSWQELLQNYWALAVRRSLPVAHTDHWRPFIERGNWTHEKIRIAHWRCALAGGQALYPDYNQGETHWEEVINQGAPWIGHATRFLSEKVQSDLRDLLPNDDWILEGDAIASANPGKEYVAYMHEGGGVALDLADAAGRFTAQWYNPRTGVYQGSAIQIQDGNPNRFLSPSQGSGLDWVLHVYQAN